MIKNIDFIIEKRADLLLVYYPMNSLMQVYETITNFFSSQRKKRNLLAKNILKCSYILKYYHMMGQFTFCLVFVTNFTTSLTNYHRRSLMFNYQQLYFGGLIYKSVQFGIFWPLFYSGMVKNPYSMIVLWGGIETMINGM